MDEDSMLNGVLNYFIMVEIENFIFLLDEILGIFFLVRNFDYENVLCYYLIISVID